MILWCLSDGEIQRAQRCNALWLFLIKMNVPICAKEILGFVYMQNSKFQNYHIECVRHMHGILNLEEIKTNCIVCL